MRQPIKISTTATINSMSMMSRVFPISALLSANTLRTVIFSFPHCSISIFPIFILRTSYSDGIGKGKVTKSVQFHLWDEWERVLCALRICSLRLQILNAHKTGKAASGKKSCIVKLLLSVQCLCAQFNTWPQLLLAVRNVFFVSDEICNLSLQISSPRQYVDDKMGVIHHDLTHCLSSISARG